jgi:hypothetical protein
MLLAVVMSGMPPMRITIGVQAQAARGSTGLETEPLSELRRARVEK